MGLDQIAYAIHPSRRKRVLNITVDSTPKQRIDLASWRKHPNLQGWMEQLYVKKGGNKTFNCIPVELTEQDLLKLKKDIINGMLPDTQGFFFGVDSDEEYKKDDLKFVDNALEEIRKGAKVYYDSWW